MAILDGRTAIVTGAGRGLGRAYARALAAFGARVLVNDSGCGVDGDGSDATPARAVVEEIRAAGGTAAPSETPVGTFAAGERLVREALDHFGRLDVLVNNAGITRSAPVATFRAEDWDAVVAVHLTGTMGCARAAFLAMHAAGRGGRIVNTTSGAALDAAYPGTAAYAAAKGGVASLTRVLAVEGASAGITCNAVAPLARTRMSAGFLADERAVSDLEPAAIAPLVVYLASDAAAGVTGEIFRFRRGRIGVARVTTDTDVPSSVGAWSVDEIAARIDEIRGRCA